MLLGGSTVLLGGKVLCTAQGAVPLLDEDSDMSAGASEDGVT